MGQKKIRLALLSSLITLLTINVSAQSFITDGPVGTDVYGEIILGVLNTVTLVEITSISMGFWFLAIIAGFYFPSKFLTAKAFGMVEEALDMGRRYRADQGDLPTGAKGFALAIAYISANGLGLLFGFLVLTALGIGSLALILLVYVGIGQTVMGDVFPTRDDDDARADGAFTDTGDDGTGPGPGGPDGPGIPDDRVPDEIGAELNNLGDAIGDIEGTLENLEDRVNQVEEEDDQIMQELRQVREDVEDLEEFRERINQMVEDGTLTERQAGEIETLIEESESLEQLEEKIEENNEKILQNEEDIEANEEQIEQLEEEIARIEQAAERDLEGARERLQQLREEQQTINAELEELNEELREGAISREAFEEAREELRSQLQQVSGQVEEVEEILEEAAQEREMMKQRIATLMRAMSDVPERFSELEERVREIEEEESQAEEMSEQEEEDTSQVADDLPESVRRGIIGDEQELRQLLGDEEGETADLEELLEGEELVFGEEEETAEVEEDIAEKIDKEFAQLANAVHLIQEAIQRDMEKIQGLEQEEMRELELEEEGIQEINQILNQVINGEGQYGQMNPQQKETIAQQALTRLDQLQQQTNDRGQQEEIRELRDKALQIQQGEAELEQAENTELQEILQDIRGRQETIETVAAQQLGGDPQRWQGQLTELIRDVMPGINRDIQELVNLEHTEHGQQQEAAIRQGVNEAENVFEELFSLIDQEARAGAATNAQTHAEQVWNSIQSSDVNYPNELRNAIGTMEEEVGQDANRWR